MIETERLILRRWRGADRAAYAAVMADPEVGYWLGGTMNSAECEAHIARLEDHFERLGYGRFAIERKADGAFLGLAGLVAAHAAYENTPVAGGVEIGWRLARGDWGSGYATEAARAALDDGFARLHLAEVLAFTTPANLRSRAVMDRLGLHRDEARDFDHPALAGDHPLSRHVVYAISRPKPTI